MKSLSPSYRIEGVLDVPQPIWSSGDRDHPERWISISPGPKDLFTDEAERSGAFVKFLKNGQWYEAERCDFERATARELVAKTL